MIAIIIITRSHVGCCTRTPRLRFYTQQRFSNNNHVFTPSLAQAMKRQRGGYTDLDIRSFFSKKEAQPSRPFRL